MCSVANPAVTSGGRAAPGRWRGRVATAPRSSWQDHRAQGGSYAWSALDAFPQSSRRAVHRVDVAPGCERPPGARPCQDSTVGACTPGASLYAGCDPASGCVQGRRPGLLLRIPSAKVGRSLFRRGFRPVDDPQPATVGLPSRHLYAEAAPVAPTCRGQGEVAAAERGQAFLRFKTADVCDHRGTHPADCLASHRRLPGRKGKDRLGLVQGSGICGVAAIHPLHEELRKVLGPSGRFASLGRYLALLQSGRIRSIPRVGPAAASWRTRRASPARPPGCTSPSPG